MKYTNLIIMVGVGSLMGACTAGGAADVVDQIGGVSDAAGAFGVPYASVVGGLLGAGAEFIRGFVVKDKKAESAGALFRAVKTEIDSMPSEERDAIKKRMKETLVKELGKKKADKANAYLQVAKQHVPAVKKVISIFRS